MSQGTIRRFLGVKVAEANPPPPEVHPDFPDETPHNLKVGSRITLKEGIAFKVFKGDLSFTHPGEEQIVEAVSTFNLLGLETIRIYLSNAHSSNKKSFIQFHRGEDGQYLDMMLFVPKEIYPKNHTEWEQWLNDKLGYFGQQEFVDPVSGNNFFRTWEDEDPEKVEPYDIMEMLFNDMVSPPSSVSHMIMLYGRNAAEATDEYVMIDFDQSSLTLCYGIYLEQKDLLSWEGGVN